MAPRGSQSHIPCASGPPSETSRVPFSRDVWAAGSAATPGPFLFGAARWGLFPGPDWSSSAWVPVFTRHIAQLCSSLQPRTQTKLSGVSIPKPAPTSRHIFSEIGGSQPALAALPPLFGASFARSGVISRFVARLGTFDACPGLPSNCLIGECQTTWVIRQPTGRDDLWPKAAPGLGAII